MEKINLTINYNNKNFTIYDIYVAEKFFEKLKGLMFVSKEKSFNLLLKNCNSVHTCFMKFNLDIFCLDKNFNVIKTYRDIKPFSFILPVKNGKHILELSHYPLG